MKFKKQLLLMAGAFAMLTATSVATASPLLDEEIFSAIDGETEYFHDTASHPNSASRVNFDMGESNTDLLHNVLSTIDGEYDFTSNDTMRVNYSMPDKSEAIEFEDSILSGVDGEYLE